MASIFKAIAGLFGGGGSVGGKAAPEAPAEDYNGYRIRPAPYQRNGQFQTAGAIEKEINGEVKEHRFIRAESHASRDDAIAFSITKAKQLIDQQGDRIFERS